jgi:hypothetical protein
MEEKKEGKMKKKRESRMILNNNKNIIFTLIIMIMQSVHRVARRMTILVEVAISIICPKTRSLLTFSLQLFFLLFII